MASSAIVCPVCGESHMRQNGHINRSRRDGKPIYCSRDCAGVARRLDKSTEQKKADKAEYDRQYREQNDGKLKVKRAQWFRRNYDPVQAAIERKAKMPRHVEYCRQPEYKAYKVEYDRRKCDEQYGEYAECARLLIEIESIIRSRMTKYERACARGYYERQNERIKRRRKQKNVGQKETFSNQPQG